MMKHKGIKTLLFCLTFGVAATFSIPALAPKCETNTVLAVSNAQHQDNFDPYTYTGTYYDSIGSNLTDGMDGTLRTTLTTKIKPASVPTYGGTGSNHLSSVLQQADEDPINPSNMIYFYTRDSVKKNAASSWNREHVWPKSLGNWNQDDAGTDLLHIRPTYPPTNTKRDNDKYGTAPTTTEVYYNGMPYGKSSNGFFEPLDSVKGDAARICMYVWVAWYNFYYRDPNNKIKPLTNVFCDYDTMIRWHILDRPDVLEGNRNDYAQTSMQKNRNPFVDHPEYAWKIFGDQLSADVLAAAKEAYPDQSGPVARLTLSENSVSLTKGQTLHLVATRSDSLTTGITWSSSNESVASVNATGLITGVKKGNATITASATIYDTLCTATCQVTVNEESQTARSWSEDFITKTGAVCKNDGKTNFDELNNVWNEVVPAFKAMDETNKGYVINPTTGPDDLTKYFADLAKKRYDFIVNKYQALEKFMGVPSNPSATKKKEQNSTNYSLLISVSVIALIVSTRLIFNIKKRK